MKIGGRPEGAGFHQGPQRRRPRGAAERIGPRPDRLAAYAVALGVLLILIAILTTQADRPRAAGPPAAGAAAGRHPGRPAHRTFADE